MHGERRTCTAMYRRVSIMPSETDASTDPPPAEKNIKEQEKHQMVHIPMTMTRYGHAAVLHHYAPASSVPGGVRPVTPPVEVLLPLGRLLLLAPLLLASPLSLKYKSIFTGVSQSRPALEDSQHKRTCGIEAQMSSWKSTSFSDESRTMNTRERFSPLRL